MEKVDVYRDLIVFHKGEKHGNIIHDANRTGPYPRGGGVNPELINRISLMEKEIDDLKKAVATHENYGLAKISFSESVTEDFGLVLSAKEKNPAVTGSLADEISKVQQKINGFEPVYGAVQNVSGFKYFNVSLLKMGKMGFCDAYVYSDESFGDVPIFNFPEGFLPYSNQYKYGVCEVSSGGSLSKEILQIHINSERNSADIAQMIGSNIRKALISFSYKIK